MKDDKILLPLVSVIIRTMNRPVLLGEALNSVKEQTYKNIEVVVVNDGGIDVRDVLGRYGTVFEKLQYIFFEKNSGRSAAANSGLDASNGEYLIFLDDDDLYEPKHIENLVNALLNQSKIKAAYSGVKLVNGDQETVLNRSFRRELLCAGNYIPFHALLFNKCLLDKGCRFDEAFNVYEDWDFWLQLSVHTSFLHCDVITAVYRSLGDSEISPHRPDLEAVDKFRSKIFEKWRKKWDGNLINQIFFELSSVKDQYTKDAEKQYEVRIDELEWLFKDAEKQHEVRIDELERFDQQSKITIELLRKRISLIKNHMQKKVREKKSLVADIAEIKSSTSWRITKPLRAIKNLLSSTKISFSFHLLKNNVFSLVFINNFYKLMNLLLPINSRRRGFVKRSIYKIVPNKIMPLNPILMGSHLKKELLTKDKKEYKKFYYDYLENSITKRHNTFVPIAGESIDNSRLSVKTIAFYLPQFHPIPENDKAWGKGFTEWTNVSKATAHFIGHYQPRLPADLGFYDLRLKEIQMEQIKLAKRYGISGFCYHHYWFGGKKLLDTPFKRVMENPDLNFPFCLCWANENWSKRWDGGEDEIIIAQNHSPEDDINFIKDIEKALKDPRYIRINGKALLILYRPELLPDPSATARRWREYAKKSGIGDLYLLSAATFGFEDYKSINFDGLVQFPPHSISATEISSTLKWLNPEFSGQVFDYQSISTNAIDSIKKNSNTYPCIMMAWDNVARKNENGHVFHNCSPNKYKKWLRNSFEYVLKTSGTENIVFINAWNEWAEGTYLEPDKKYGYSYLNATANVIREFYKKDSTIAFEIEKSKNNFNKTSDAALVLYLYYEDLFEDFFQYFKKLGKIDLFISLPEHVSLDTILRIREKLPKAYLAIYENQGRDILPFINLFKVINNKKYKFLGKVHSKKTTYREDGSKIRQHLIESLLSKEIVKKILEKLNNDPRVGVIVPPESILSLSEPNYVVNNLDHLRILIQKMGQKNTALDFPFISGSMFWARTDALLHILNLQLSKDDFEEELGQTDGTMAHAIERLFLYSAILKGYQYIETSDIE